MLLRTLFYLCVFTLSLGQFAAFLNFGESKVYLFDLALGVFCTFGVVYFLAIKKSLKLPKYLYAFLLFSFVAFLSLLLNLSKLAGLEFLISGFYLVRWVVYLFSAVVVFNMLKHKIFSKEQLVATFVYSGVFIALAGFVQLALLPDFETLDTSLGWDPHKNRLASTFFDPNFTGGYLILCLVSLFDLYLKAYRTGRQLKSLGLFLGSGVTMLVALLLTFSRSSWAMFALVVFIYGIFRYRKLLLLSFLIGFLAYFAVPRVQTRLSGVTDPADSAHFRLISWKNTWEIAKDNLFLGVGFNTFRYVQKDYGFFDVGSLGGHAGSGSDSSFLLVLATTGVIGLVLFGVGYLLPLWRIVMRPYHFVGASLQRLGLVATLGGLFIHSQFVNSLFFPQIMFLWLVILASRPFSRT